MTLMQLDFELIFICISAKRVSDWFDCTALSQTCDLGTRGRFLSFASMVAVILMMLQMTCSSATINIVVYFCKRMTIARLKYSIRLIDNKATVLICERHMLFPLEQ